MNKTLAAIAVALIAFGGLITTTSNADAGWRKSRGYSKAYAYSRSYRPYRPYYGRRYYGRPYYGGGYYGGPYYGYGCGPWGGCSAGEALGGVLVGLAAIAAIQAASNPSPNYYYAPVPAPGQTGPACVGGPNWC